MAAKKKAKKAANPTAHYSQHYRRAPGMTQTTISLSRDLLDDIKTLAQEEHRTVSNFIVKELIHIVEERMSKKHLK